MSKKYIVSTYVNCGYYLYDDAKYLHMLAQQPENKDLFDRVRLCRTAIILYLLSLEAYINRAIFIQIDEDEKRFIKKYERKSLSDKVELLPSLFGASGNENLKDKPIWRKFRELKKFRDEFIHRKPYIEAFIISEKGKEKGKYLRHVNQLPKDFFVDENKIKWPETKIPKDPYAITIYHVEKNKSNS
mgnify:FL=1